MNKAELVQQVAAAAEIPKARAERAVEAVLDAVSSTLAAGGEVGLVGFGRFSVRQAAARVARNPKSGEEIQVPAHRRVVFRAGKELRERVK